MTGVVMAGVMAFGVIVSLYANYLAWSWVLGVRRRTRERRLLRPDESPPFGSGVKPRSADMPVDSPR